MKRPRLKVNLTITDKILEFINFVVLGGIWIYTLINYSSLPDTIPTHYNLAGKADGFDNKTNLLILLIVSTIIFVGLTVMNIFPHLFNYPKNITKDNMLKQYTIATKMIRVLKLIIIIMFSTTIFQTIRNSQGYSDEGLGIWFTPLFLVMIFATIIYYLIVSKKSS